VRTKRFQLDWRKRLRRRRWELIERGLFVVPHLFTLGNAFFGFCSLILAANGEMVAAAHFILLGALMDMLDGRIARLFGTASEFGVQIDSLSDIISFCCAPAFLVYSWQLHRAGFFGIVVSFLFLAAGMVRLARYNIIHQEQTLFFLGLPTTIAGCFLASLILNIPVATFHGAPLIGLIAIVIALSLLMVSFLKFPAFKRRLRKERKNWHLIGLVMAFAAAAVLRLDRTVLLFFSLYLLYSLTTMHQRRRRY